MIRTFFLWAGHILWGHPHFMRPDTILCSQFLFCQARSHSVRPGLTMWGWALFCEASRHSVRSTSICEADGIPIPFPWASLFQQITADFPNIGLSNQAWLRTLFGVCVLYLSLIFTIIYCFIVFSFANTLFNIFKLGWFWNICRL